jgi:3-hydroxy-3-methylglutaryl CoA synthase
MNQFRQVPHSDSTKEVKDAFWDNIMGASKDLLIEKLNPHIEFNQRIGNMYTASLWAQFLNVIKK